MKIPSPLRFVVGSALLVAPACGPDQPAEPEEIPVRTNVRREAPTWEEPTDNTSPTEEPPTMEAATMEGAADVVDPAPNPSPDTTGDPQINPSSGERIELRPDAPYHPTKAQ